MASATVATPYQLLHLILYVPLHVTIWQKKPILVVNFNVDRHDRQFTKYVNQTFAPNHAYPLCSNIKCASQQITPQSTMTIKTKEEEKDES